MIEEIIGVLDGYEGYEGLRLVIQNGTPQIVDFRPECISIAEEARRLEEHVTKLRSEADKRLSTAKKALEEADKLFEEIRRIAGRIGAYTRAVNARRRRLAELEEAIRRGRIPYRLAVIISRMTGLSIDEIRENPGRAIELMRRTIGYYEELILKLREKLREIVSKRRELIEEAREEVTIARKYLAEAEESEKRMRELLARAEECKLVVVPIVDHIDIVVTYATKTCEGHEPFVAEIHMTTTIIGSENINSRKIKEVQDALIGEIAHTALEEYFTKALADNLMDDMMKTGTSLKYSPLPDLSTAYPTVKVEIEYGWADKSECTSWKGEEELKDIIKRGPRSYSTYIRIG